MNINIIRGSNQIGGNIIEIQTQSTKIILDVGLELDDEKNKDLPDLAGLFRYKGYDAIFISHYHGDHVGLAYKVHPDIPIYIGESSYKVLKASDAYKNVESFKPEGYMVHNRSIKIGDITVTPYLCDHSAFDSYMILCESEGELVLYTGDFRSNGRKSFEGLLKQLPNNIDKLICEGTTLSRTEFIAQTEPELEALTLEILKKYSGPVFILLSSMNIDRIVTFYRAAKQIGRVFLQELYMADITSTIGGHIPNPAFDDVYPFITNPNRYNELRKYSNRVGKSFISKRPFVMCVRTSMLDYIHNLSKEMRFQEGLLIYSLWDGYKDTTDMKTFLEECEKLGLTIKTLHTTGHADEATIRKLIATVRPKEIIPIHTENPKWFERIGGIKDV